MNVTELMSAPWFVKGWIAAGDYLLLLASSGPVVSVVLENIGGERETGTRKTEDPDTSGAESEGDDESNSGDERVSERERDVGQVVGKCENVLVLSFVLASAYTALAVVFAAKSIVRREDMVKNSKYYLAGTLVNFTYSILFALALKQTVSMVS